MPHLRIIGPHLGTVAPHLGALLPHAEMLTRIIPKLSTKLDLLLSGDLLEKVAPTFAALDPEHMAKLEMVLDDVVDKLDLLAPHIATFTPILEDGIMVADRMLPFIEHVIPHLVALQADLDWLLPFAEIEGVEKLIPLMDKIVPRLEAIRPIADSIRPHLPMLLKQAPIIADNIDVLIDILPQLGANDIDPLLCLLLSPLGYLEKETDSIQKCYLLLCEKNKDWCGNLIPLANSMGILKSRTLLKAALPFAGLLPSVPAQHSLRVHRAAAGEAEVEGREWWRFGLLGRTVELSRIKFVGGVAYYVLEVDERYAGEFRYRYLRELYIKLQPVLPDICPEFPGRTLMAPTTSAALEQRRVMLEEFLIFVLDDPILVRHEAFIEFVRVRRRWAGDLPLLKSPLLIS